MFILKYSMFKYILYVHYDCKHALVYISAKKQRIPVS